jgi:hypothetical protein
MGDLCEDTFGNTKLLPSGSIYNVTFGTRPYLIQRIWVNARGGYCALARTSKSQFRFILVHGERSVVSRSSRKGVRKTVGRSTSSGKGLG